MPDLNEGRYAHDWLKREADSLYSRREGILASGSGVVLSGTVLTLAAGKWQPVLAATAGDAKGILLVTADATDADADVVIVARDAIVAHQALLYGADIDTPAERAAVHAALEALSPPILVREGA